MVILQGWLAERSVPLAKLERVPLLGSQRRFQPEVTTVT